MYINLDLLKESIENSAKQFMKHMENQDQACKLLNPDKNHACKLVIFSKDPTIPSKTIVMGTYDYCRNYALKHGYTEIHQYLFRNVKTNDEVVIVYLSQENLMKEKHDYIFIDYEEVDKQDPTILMAGTLSECQQYAKELGMEETPGWPWPIAFWYDQSDKSFAILYVGKTKEEIIDYYRKNIGELYVDPYRDHMICKDGHLYGKVSYLKIANTVGEHCAKNNLSDKIYSNTAKAEDFDIKYNARQITITDNKTNQSLVIQSWTSFSIVNGIIKIEK